MKLITAFEAEDGQKFFEKANCEQHEKAAYFRTWFGEHPIGTRFNAQPATKQLRHWLTTNAEAIRGFLPPVAAKPELNIDHLETYRWIPKGELKPVVSLEMVEQWLAGEL